MPKLDRPWVASPNYSGRYGTPVRLVVIHSSEGAQKDFDLANYFANPNAAVSSQVCIDDGPAWRAVECVKRGNAAWTQANYNSDATSAELCTPSGASGSWSRADWLAHDNMLRKCAQWVAEECAYFGLDVDSLAAGAAQGSGRGVCEHKDLGSGGGGHVNCGPGFPVDKIIEWAKGGGAATSEEDHQMPDRLLFVNGPHEPVSIPNLYSKDGNGRIRLVKLGEPATVRCDWIGGSEPTETKSIGYDTSPDGFAIPKGRDAAALHLDTGEGPVSMSFSRPESG